MGDLLDHSAQARPLTIAHQGVAACLAVYVAAFTRFPVDDGVLIMLREVLPHAHGEGPTAEALVKAGRAVLAAHDGPAPSGMQWIEVDEAAEFAVRLYYRQRAAATHAKIFPETQEVPAHAAE